MLMALPAQRAWEVGTKFEPLIVSVNVGDPALTDPGEREETTGTGFCKFKVRELEVAPPGLIAKTPTDPASGIALAGICAVIWEAEDKAVGTNVPFTFTCAPAIKLAPFKVIAKVLPAKTVLGEIELRLMADKIVTGRVDKELPTEGVLTKTWALPAAATRVAGTTALRAVGEIQVVVNGVLAPPETCQVTTELV